MAKQDLKSHWYVCTNDDCRATEYATGAAPACCWCGAPMRYLKITRHDVKTSGQRAMAQEVPDEQADV